MKTIVATFSLYLVSTLAALANEGCVPLAEQYPELGTSQSVSASKDFTTVWGFFELPGGPCGFASAEGHYYALLQDARSRGGPTEHTLSSLPDWSGHWGTDNNVGEIAIVGINVNREGTAVRLNPEAQAVFLSDLQRWDGWRSRSPCTIRPTLSSPGIPLSPTTLRTTARLNSRSASGRIIGTASKAQTGT